jgi:hypothetical protein
MYIFKLHLLHLKHSNLNVYINFYFTVYPSKMLCFQALGLRVNFASSPGCQNTSSYFHSHWHHNRACLTTVLPGVSLLVTCFSMEIRVEQNCHGCQMGRFRDRLAKTLLLIHSECRQSILQGVCIPKNILFSVIKFTPV